MTIKLLIADDHEVIRSGLVSLLSGSDIKVVGEAATGKETLKLAAQHKPDVILLDVRLGESDGFAVVEKLRKSTPKSRVVILSTYDNSTYMARAALLGVSDYLLKGASRHQLISTIQGAAGGAPPSDHGELKRVTSVLSTQHSSRLDDVPLTNRELQVLKHVALGLSNKQIASSLEISVETVKEHVQNVLRKLQVTDRTQAAVWAVRKGLVD